jgi:hypothetical protein
MQTRRGRILDGIKIVLRITTVMTAFPGISACQQITVQSPVELQVPQRNQQNSAEVAVSGVMDGSADVARGKRRRESFVQSTRTAVPANDSRPLFPDQDENRRHCERHGMEIDERYV